MPVIKNVHLISAQSRTYLRKTGLVGERQSQPYAPHGAKRNN